MRDHISFEELETFVYAEKLTPELLRLGSRINAHVLSCSECAAAYTAMIELRETSLEAGRSRREEVSRASAQSQRDLIEEQFSGEYVTKGDGLSKSNEPAETKQRELHF